MASVRIKLTVEIVAEHREGKFASRDELAEQALEMIEGADEGTFYGDEGGEYETVEWAVEVAS